MTAINRLMQLAREYAYAYDPEHAQIRPEFLFAAIPKMDIKACAIFAEVVAEECPNFWPFYREYLAQYYKVSIASVARQMQDREFGDLSRILPDRMTAELMRLAERHWKHHAKNVKTKAPADYLLGEILMLDGDLDVLDLVLSDCDIDREGLTPYLAGASRHMTNAYLNANINTRTFDNLEDAMDWIVGKSDKPKKATDKKAKETPPPSKLADIEQQLRARVIGQSSAIDAVVRSLKIAEAGLKDPAKPIAVLLFAGPTGVGKTELARVTAETTARPFKRFDMSEYQESHSVMRLFGAPPSYVGYDDGGQLTKFASDNPKGVIVFDEAEKAHPDVMNALLQIAEEGTLTDGKGKVVSFAETLIFITTNIGADEAGRRSIGFGGNEGSRSHAFKLALEKFFKPELRGRLTATVIFEPLSAEDIRKIAVLELAKLAARLDANRSITLAFAREVADFIAQESNTLQYGARNLKVTINNLIAEPLSDYIVAGTLRDKSRILAGIESGTITFNAPPPVTEMVRFARRRCSHLVFNVGIFFATFNEPLANAPPHAIIKA